MFHVLCSDTRAKMLGWSIFSDNELNSSLIGIMRFFAAD